MFKSYPPSFSAFSLNSKISYSYKLNNKEKWHEKRNVLIRNRKIELNGEDETEVGIRKENGRKGTKKDGDVQAVEELGASRFHAGLFYHWSHQ